MNFDFLTKTKDFEDFSSACIDAESATSISYANSAILTRRALELAVRWMYINDADLEMPYRDNLSSLIYNSTFISIIPEEIFARIKYIVSLGNSAVHTNGRIKKDEAIEALNNLFEFVEWIDYSYGNDYVARKFDESCITAPNSMVSKQDYYELSIALSEKDRRLQELIEENEALRKAGKANREKPKSTTFNVDEISEYKTRKLYIDLMLKDAGWDFAKNIGEEFEVNSMPYESGKGYVDYVLFGDDGKIIALVEAKKTSIDPHSGQHQAKLYADCLEKEKGLRPVIFFSNGFKTHIWDDTMYPERSISGFLTKDEIQLLIDRRKTRRSIANPRINEDITNRYYQKSAITNVCNEFSEGRRKALLVMATGSGKTRVAVSLVDVLSKNNWVKNVLFLADRRELVEQAKGAFTTLLPSISSCNLLNSNDDPETSRIIISTYPTMMNAIDTTKNKYGDVLFTPGHFDLIIIDESHRSIYKKYKAIFDYYDSLLVGLTATPKDEVDINTYDIFDLERGNPTYAYEYEQAVKDNYLVDYITYEEDSEFIQHGIHYDDLSDEEKELYEDTFGDDDNVKDDISASAINDWVFNKATIDRVIHITMENGIKIQGGDVLGKTIIFAKNQKHALAIEERFNTLYPQYNGHFASVITYNTKNVSDLIKKFKQGNSFPQIAISVDMLDTGVDIPEVVNLVFFKEIRSKVKFWQMVGRGTRLCPDLFGPNEDKKCFKILDFYGNLEFFRAGKKTRETGLLESLSQRIFNLKLDIVKELQSYCDDESLHSFRQSIVCDLLKLIHDLDENSFNVKLVLEYVHRYKNKDNWNDLDSIKVKEIKEYISPLISIEDRDEMAKRFDRYMYNIELAKLKNNNAISDIKIVIKMCNALYQKQTIPDIQENNDYLYRAKDSYYWREATLIDIDAIRERIRSLVKYLDKNNKHNYFTNFTDTITEVRENTSFYHQDNLTAYNERVNHYIEEHINDEIINKIQNNIALSVEEIKDLERIMWTDLGNKDEYAYYYRDEPVLKLVRSITKLSHDSVISAFSEFISDQSLNSKQIAFVKKIMDYVEINGFIDDFRVFDEDPFKSIGSITQVFNNNMTIARNIVARIKQINFNGGVVTA